MAAGPLSSRTAWHRGRELRLFVALEVPPQIGDRLGRAIASVRDRLPRGSWVAPGRFHLTLVFIGDCNEFQTHGLSEALEEPFASSGALELELEGAGFFPSRGRPRVGWVGLRASPEVLDLQEGVRRATQRVLGAAERGREGFFRPHLTVVRPRTRWSAEARRSFCETIAECRASWKVERGVLMESLLGGGPARYRVQQDFWLSGRRQ